MCMWAHAHMQAHTHTHLGEHIHHQSFGNLGNQGEKWKLLLFLCHVMPIIHQLFGLFQARLTKEHRWGSALLSRNHSLEEEFERAKAAVEVTHNSISSFWKWHSRNSNYREMQIKWNRRHAENMRMVVETRVWPEDLWFPTSVSVCLLFDLFCGQLGMPV